VEFKPHGPTPASGGPLPTGGANALQYTFHFSDVLRYWPLLFQGTLNTIVYSLVGMLAGLAVGVAGAVGRNSPHLTLRAVATSYVEIVRNTPLLVQLFIFFFALPSLGLRLSPVQAALLALVFNNGAYMTEIVRAGIDNVHPSQREAAVSLGLTGWQTFRYVVLFQALERIYPAMISQFVMLMLSTSLVSAIGADDLTGFGSRIQSLTFRSFEIYMVIGVIYLGLTLVLQAAAGTIARFMFRRGRAGPR
jgi:polar amino acid transport system permease protein